MLIKDVNAESQTAIRLYERPNNQPHYVTTGLPSSPTIKQAFIEPAPTTFQAVDNAAPSRVSSSYP